MTDNNLNDSDTNTIKEENKPKSKEEHILDYIRALKEIDDLITPFSEAKIELKKLYKENNWLDKNEMSNILKSFRLLKAEDDIEEIYKYYDLLKRKKILDVKE